MNETYDKYFQKPPDPDPRIYAFALPTSLPGQLKVGYTSRGKAGVLERIREYTRTDGQFPEARSNLVVNESAIRDDGTAFLDHPVHRWLKEHGCRKGAGVEWFYCTKEQVLAAIKSVRTGKDFSASRTNDFKPRKEQEEAIEKTVSYFKRAHSADPSSPPKFLWNAKMRFGKTFTALETAVRMHMKHVLVISFKVEVKRSWRDELYGHIDFEGWKWVDVKDKESADKVTPDDCFLAFGSFQDLLGKNNLGGIKAKNQWVHDMNWDMIIFDEYHFGSWREKAQGLFDSGEEKDMRLLDENILPITTDYMLFLSGTPFRAINTGEFVDDQIFNWTYSDEQEAKASWDDSNGINPYSSMPEMVLLTYQLPEECTKIALRGEQNEFDLNEFFRAEAPRDENGRDNVEEAKFVHENEVQRWLDIIRNKPGTGLFGKNAMGESSPVLPFYDSTLLESLNHTLWYMHSVASCYAMRNLLRKDNNVFYHDYRVVVAAGNRAGSGAKALDPVFEAMDNPLKTKTITITCGKLTTGVTVKPWTGIFMLSSISTPESYFQSAFRVQSGWTIPSEVPTDPPIIKKSKCYIFDFAPNRALRQLSEYACSLDTEINKTSEQKIAEFTKFLPVLAFDGTGMYEISASEILDYVASGTTASLLAKKWNSARLVNVDDATLTKIIENDDAMDAVMSIEGFRSLGSNTLETIVSENKKIKEGKGKETSEKARDKERKKELDAKEKETKSKRKQVQEKLQKFATRIPLFMYLTDYREETLSDVITKIEPGLFQQVTGINVSAFQLLVKLGVFNSSAMNEAVAAFRRYEESSLDYAGISMHYGEMIGLWDIKVDHSELSSISDEQSKLKSEEKETKGNTSATKPFTYYDLFFGNTRERK